MFTRCCGARAGKLSSALRSLCVLLAALCGALLLLYAHFQRRYLLDLDYEVTGPVEYDISEKFTVRVPATDNFDQLKAFVEHYTLCQRVHEIQIVWTSKKTPPSVNDFTYYHTHSVVTFEEQPDALNGIFTGKLPIHTDAVFLADPDVIVSCDDLHFTYSVWKTSRTAMVGFFPRLHTEAEHEWQYLGWGYVWWNGVYSMVLPSGAFVAKRYLAEYAISSKLLAEVDRLGGCADLAFILSTTQITRTPPIYVQVPVSYSKWRYTPPIGAGVTRSKCLQQLIDVMGDNPLLLSTHKAYPAKDALFW